MTPLEAKFGRAVAMIQAASDPPVRDHAIALFVKDAGPRVGLLPRPDVLRNLRPLDPQQQAFASELLNSAHRILRGPDPT